MIDSIFPGGISRHHYAAPKAVIRSCSGGTCWHVWRGPHFIGAFATLDEAKLVAGKDATVEGRS